MKTVREITGIVFDTEYDNEEHMLEERELIIFNTQCDMENYIESHSRPENLILKEEEYVSSLKLIYLKNNLKRIKESVESEYIVKFEEIIEFLKEKRLIIYIGRNWMDNFSNDWYKLTKRGRELIGVKDKNE